MTPVQIQNLRLFLRCVAKGVTPYDSVEGEASRSGVTQKVAPRFHARERKSGPKSKPGACLRLARWPGAIVFYVVGIE